jgi:nitroreductase
MEFNDVVRTRRTVRAYMPEPVPKTTLQRIFENVRVAPSANNTQPWHFYVIGRPDLKLQIAKLAFSHKFVATAPLIIICCGKSYLNPYGWIGDKMFLIDCAIAMDHLTLAARNEGLGTCWISDFNHEGIKKLINIPKGYEIVMLTPLGRPVDQQAFRATRIRRTMESMVTELP